MGKKRSRPIGERKKWGTNKLNREIILFNLLCMLINEEKMLGEKYVFRAGGLKMLRNFFKYMNQKKWPKNCKGIVNTGNDNCLCR
jgi:hypothetical protein